MFIKTGKEGKVFVLSLYVDDIIFTDNDELMISEFKNSMKHEFDMTDLGKSRYFLSLKVLQNSKGLFISKKKVCIRGAAKVWHGYKQFNSKSNFSKL